VEEAGFTSSSGGVRALSVHAKKELSDKERLETASSRVRRSGKVSNPGQSQLPEGIRLLLWISTGERLWRSLKGGQPKERRRKAGQSELSHRGGHGVSAGPVKTFRNAGDGKNATAGLWIKGNLRARGETRGTGQTHRQKRWLTRRSAVKTRTKVTDVS
jgi:hypothetical protein